MAAGTGKTLRDRHKEYLETDLGQLSPGPVGWDENPDRRPLDLEALFGGREVWVEVGFGGGEHMVHQAARNPDVGLIGAEPFINAVAMLLGKIRAAGVDNIRIHRGRRARPFRRAARRLGGEGVPPLSRSLAQGAPPPPPAS